MRYNFCGKERRMFVDSHSFSLSLRVVSSMGFAYVGQLLHLAEKWH